MNLIDRLSSSQNRKDQHPNIELGKEISKHQDLSSLAEIKRLLKNKDVKTEIKADLLKTLEAVGESSPELIAGFYSEVRPFLNHEKNYMTWRAMCVLSLISPFNRKRVFEDLGDILRTMDEGSVITRDHGFSMLVDLYTDKKYQSDLSVLIQEQLMKAPDNQLGQYAEKWLDRIANNDEKRLLELLEQRHPDLANETHQKRIGKVIRKLIKRMKQ